VSELRVYFQSPSVHLSSYLSIYLSMALQPLWTLAAFFTFLIFYIVGKTPWKGDQPCHKAGTYTTEQQKHSTSTRSEVQI
jgi:hypothetical protein